MSTPEIITPSSPRWAEFIDKIQDEVGFGKCTHDHAGTIETLNKMGANVEASLADLIARGGNCDCEVIYNVVLPSLESHDSQ